MEASGALKEIAPSVSASCPYCCYDSVQRVTFLDDRRTGGKRGYISCRECGLIEVPTERLQRWTVNVPGFIHAAFSAGGAAVTPSEYAEGRLWRVGRATWAGRSREVFFVPAFRRAQKPAIVAELASRPKSLLFFPTEVSMGRWENDTANVVLPLDAVLTQEGDPFVFDVEYVESRLMDAGLADEPKKTSPRKKRGPRTAHIEALTREMMEHVRAARDHAIVTRDHTGFPQLLPRPTQAELARRVKISEASVSRCLNDKTARELQFLWELSLDADRLISFRA